MLKALLFGTSMLSTVVLAAAISSAGPGSQGHDHDHSFSAGEPGNAKNRSRIIAVTMGEESGKMLFNPDRIEVRRGEQIRFVLKNAGELEHEFVLGTREENRRHAEQMQKNPDMEHDDPNGKRITPKKAGEILWRFTKSGEFEFACLIPGHLEAGMLGKVVVR